MLHGRGGHDEYYTDETLAESLVRIVVHEFPNTVLFIEPSAGRGAFVKPLLALNYPVAAYDIKPQHKEIAKADFLEDVTSKRFTDGLTIAIGNPPFGFNSSKAVRFFNKCAKISDYICFIVPRTFKKISLLNKLDNHFYLRSEYPIPKKAFILDGSPYSVPCVFQIWERKTIPRQKIVGDLSKYLIVVKPHEADFAMRRVGGKAGQILTGLNHSKSSTYFFKEMQFGVKECLICANFGDVANNTAGVRSVSQLEIFNYLEQKFQK